MDPDPDDAEEAALDTQGGWVDEAEFESVEAVDDPNEAPDPAPDDDSGEAPPARTAPEPSPKLAPLDDLSDLVPPAITSLGLAETDSAHVHLAESALWLALSCLGEPARAPLEGLLAGRAWESVRPGLVHAPAMQRLALGLLLQRAASDPGCGVAARAAAALAAVALGCADPKTGVGLQRGFARLSLLEITEQIPVALPIRMTTLEFRHLRLEAPIPPAFIARVEDLLDRLDHQALLPLSLKDHPDERPHDTPGEAQLEALVRSRSPSIRSLARVVLRAEEPLTAEALLGLLAVEAPASWDLPAATAAPALTLRYGALRDALASTPFALLAPEDGYGVAASSDGPA